MFVSYWSNFELYHSNNYCATVTTDPRCLLKWLFSCHCMRYCFHSPIQTKKVITGDYECPCNNCMMSKSRLSGKFQSTICKSSTDAKSIPWIIRFSSNLVLLRNLQLTALWQTMSSYTAWICSQSQWCTKQPERKNLIFTFCSETIYTWSSVEFCQQLAMNHPQLIFFCLFHTRVQLSHLTKFITNPYFLTAVIA